jgi:hypothetical protein
MMKKKLEKAFVIGIIGILIFDWLIPGHVNLVKASEYDEATVRKPIVVSLGDSYSSGEGIEPFYYQNSDINVKIEKDDWLAHRSENSWPGMLTVPGLEGDLADNKDKNWFFQATSGATTNNIRIKDDPDFEPGFLKEYDKQGKKGSKLLPAQIGIFDELPPNSVDYVTLTIGGNDLGFASIIERAVIDSAVNIGEAYAIHKVDNPFVTIAIDAISGGDYLIPSKLPDQLNDAWDMFKGSTSEDIKSTYIEVCEAAGDQAELIVAGYPKLLCENGGGALFTAEQAGLINSKVQDFNEGLREIVDCCSEEYNVSFVSVEEAFNGHEAYSEDSYINGLNLLVNPVTNPTEDIQDWLVSSSYSIHPNLQGAKAYASCVQERIDEIEEEKSAKNIESNPLASEEELKSKDKHYKGVVLYPEDVVLKMFDALQEGDYEMAAECLDPATEQQLDFWGEIASTLVGLFTGEYISWGQLLLEAAGATDVSVIECYSENLEYTSNFDLLSALIPSVPGIKKLVCTEADVHVKYRYKYNDDYRIQEEDYHVRRYEWAGWRIEQN